MKDAGNFVFVACTATFAALSAAAGLRLLHPVDVRVLILLQDRVPNVPDGVGLTFSALGEPEFTGAALIVLSLGLYLYGRRALAGRLPVVFVVSGALELAMKFLLPQVPIPGEAIRAADPALLDVATPYPYPSGHMLRSVIVFGAVYLLWPNALARVAILALLAGSAVARVYLGAHWPSDVVGGALLGTAALAWAFGRKVSGHGLRASARTISEA